MFSWWIRNESFFYGVIVGLCCTGAIVDAFTGSWEKLIFDILVIALLVTVYAGVVRPRAEARQAAGTER